MELERSTDNVKQIKVKLQKVQVDLDIDPLESTLHD